MARLFLATAALVFLSAAAGCQGPDAGNAQLLPSMAGTAFDVRPTPDISNAGEADLVEEVAISRNAYRQGLRKLAAFYSQSGDNMKLTWAKRELAALESMPKYDYLIEASLAGPDLKASASIPQADSLYIEALNIEKTAGSLAFLKDKNLLRIALGKYNELIRKHPSSDKIDDAAYRAAAIYEYFKDYSIAALYYQRAYQWDPLTPYPARFKEAYILDNYLHRRAEAVEAYQRALSAVKSASEHRQWAEYARKRLAVLTKTEQKGR